MKLCAIQVPFADSPEDAVKSVEMMIAQLQQCDNSCDIILTPEYSNAPGRIPAARLKEFASAQTRKLIPSAVETARRCHAIVAVNFLAEVSPGEFRNITRIFDRQGNCAGEFHKQHLPEAEKQLGVSFNYTFDNNPPPIVEIEGIRFGFLICYDTYFTEYIAHLIKWQPDLILVSSFQRAEKQEVLRFMNQNLAFNCNAFILRASVSMGENAEVGGMSMAVDPHGRILAEFGSKTGRMECIISDIHHKNMRSNSFGGKLIPNDRFVTQGRTPWVYRPAGPMTIPANRILPYPRIAADRGFTLTAPPNSPAAFGAAIAMGAKEIAADLQFTRDGIPVLCDARITAGRSTLAELKKLDIGTAFHAGFAGLTVATLEELLTGFSRHAIIDLHILPVDGLTPDHFDTLAGLLKKYDADEHVWFTSTAEILQLAEKAAPEIPRCLISGDEHPESVENAVKYHCQKLLLPPELCRPELIEKAHSCNIIAGCTTCDDPEKAAGLLNAGLDTVLTGNYFVIAQKLNHIKPKQGK